MPPSMKDIAVEAAAIADPAERSRHLATVWVRHANDWLTEFRPHVPGSFDAFQRHVATTIRELSPTTDLDPLTYLTEQTEPSSDLPKEAAVRLTDALSKPSIFEPVQYPAWQRALAVALVAEGLTVAKRGGPGFLRRLTAAVSSFEWAKSGRKASVDNK